MDDEIYDAGTFPILGINPNERMTSLQKYEQSLTPEERKTYYALRSKKAAESRKTNAIYAKHIKQACRALSSGTFDVFDDGTELTGGDILALNLFERAKSDDKSLALYVKLTGDVKEDEEKTESPYEDFIKGVQIKF